MNILIAYDVSTITPEGRRRLRQVAQACTDFGQRVQYSLFECSLGDADFVRLRNRLLAILNCQEDSLRIYRLTGRCQDSVEVHGRDRRIDFDDPLIV